MALTGSLPTTKGYITRKNLPTFFRKSHQKSQKSQKIPKISLGKTQKSLKKFQKSQKNPKNLKKSQKTLKNPKNLSYTFWEVIYPSPTTSILVEKGPENIPVQTSNGHNFWYSNFACFFGIYIKFCVDWYTILWAKMQISARNGLGKSEKRHKFSGSIFGFGNSKRAQQWTC